MAQMTWNSKGYERFDKERAQEYAIIANEVFAPVYPVVARIVMERSGVRNGVCLDLGCGAANLAMALADMTDLRLYAIDFAPEIVRFARENVAKRGLGDRVTPLAADVHRIPLKSGIASLVVSRGSVRFWRNKPAAFREIRRLLGPGGKGFIGGGMGSPEVGEEISREMIRRGADWQKKPKRNSDGQNRTKWNKIMKKAGFHNFEVINDESGSWVWFEQEG